MLCLSRRRGETIRVGHNIRFTVLEISEHQVRIGVAAPNSLSVHREEIYRRIHRNKVPEPKTCNDLKGLNGLIVALGAVLESEEVQGDAADELRAELATLKAQAASPRPKLEILQATARAINSVAPGNILGGLAKPHTQTLLALAGS
ncbi:carbon storage regulator CsrA [Pseudomonas fluorescens]|uniref:carbon storage regulator CsrA n=1 Tax=Pseudomonas fluorescens TaxID=294 RepID=UPI001CA535E7